MLDIEPCHCLLELFGFLLDGKFLHYDPDTFREWSTNFLHLLANNPTLDHDLLIGNLTRVRAYFGAGKLTSNCIK